MSDDLIKPLSQWGVRELARATGISPTTATRVKRGDVLDSRTMQAVMKVTGFCLCCGQNAADRIEQLERERDEAVEALREIYCDGDAIGLNPQWLVNAAGKVLAELEGKE